MLLGNRQGEHHWFDRIEFSSMEEVYLPYPCEYVEFLLLRKN